MIQWNDTKIRLYWGMLGNRGYKNNIKIKTCRPERHPPPLWAKCSRLLWPLAPSKGTGGILTSKGSTSKKNIKTSNEEDPEISPEIEVSRTKSIDLSQALLLPSPKGWEKISINLETESTPRKDPRPPNPFSPTAKPLPPPKSTSSIT